MKADRIFKNGKIYTVNDNRDWVQAVAIRAGKIIYTGNNEGVGILCGEDTQINDLEGKMMIPGFFDAHCHPVLAAYLTSGIYLDIEYSIEECISKIKKYMDDNPDRKNYFGLGYAEWLFDEKGPDRSLLDEICNSKPVMILGSSGHEAWVNTKALEAANVSAATPDPAPGFQYFERDKEGNPTGHLSETGPIVHMLMHIDFFDDEIIREKIIRSSAEYAAMGVTSIADMGIYPYLADSSICIMAELTENGEFMQRVTGCGMYVDNLSEIEGHIERLAALKEKYNSDHFRINFLKLMNDGTIESRTAALSEPYDEDGSLVKVMVGGKRLADICIEAAASDLDIHVHAIGDAASLETLKMAEALRSAGFNETRITNAHTDYVKPEHRHLFGKFNVIANTTTVWHYGNPDMNRVIGERADNTFTLKSIIEGGALLSLGSDYPVDEYGREPLKGIEMGVTRQLFDRPDAPVLKPYNEKLSIDDCIAGYTRNAAYQVRMDKKLGSIEKGKYADLVILEKNIFDVPVNEIHKVKVCETILEGRTLFKA